MLVVLKYKTRFLTSCGRAEEGLLLLGLLAEKGARGGGGSGAEHAAGRLLGAGAGRFPAGQIVFVAQLFQRLVFVLFHARDALVVRVDVGRDIVLHLFVRKVSEPCEDLFQSRLVQRRL